MTEHDALLRRIDDAADEVADVLAGGGDEPGREVLTEAREHLATAWHSSAAGTELPAGTRLRQVKRGVLAVTRPLTAQQVPFNREVVVAVDRLARVVDELIDRVALSEDRSRTAGSRVQAALATTDLAVDDLADGTHRLASAFDDVVERVERIEQRLAEQRADVRALRGRQDIVLRALRDIGAAAGSRGGDDDEAGPAAAAAAPTASPAATAVAAQLAAATDELGAELADLAAGPREEVLADRARWWSEIGALPGGGPVVDLAAGRGEWLEVLAEHEVQAWGVEVNGHLRAQAQRRGLDVRDEDPLEHLGGLDEASVGALTAFGGLAGRLRPAAVAELVDRALVALRPGGVLVVEVPNVTALDVGAAEVWLDPLLVRPAHPAALELLVLARGFAEAEVRWREPVDEAWQLRPDDLGTGDGARAEALVERLNRLLAGPRRAAVVARKAGAPPG